MASSPDQINRARPVYSGLEEFSGYSGGQYTYEETSWFEGVAAAIALQPIWQGISTVLEGTGGKPDPTFNPFAPANIAGYEQFADEFIHVRNRIEMERIKDRIALNLQRRALVEQELGLGGMIVSELFNPVNYLPLPILRATTFLRGVGRGAFLGGAVIGAEEVARGYLDPTSTPEEQIANVAFGAAFTGLLGGVASVLPKSIKRRSEPELGRAYALETAYREELLANNGFLRALPASPEKRDSTRTAFPAFEIRPTEGEAGVAKAFGIENQTRATLWGQLKATGRQALNDWADMFLGDFSTMSLGNAKGRPTAQSIRLNADVQWRAPGAGVVQAIRNAFAEMELKSGRSAEIVGVNVTTAKRAIVEALSKAPRPDGKMRYDEFRDEVFKAYAKEGKSDNPYVNKAIQEVRNFMKKAEKAGKESGALYTHEKHRDLLSRKVDEARAAIERIQQLEAKAARSTREELELYAWKQKRENLAKWLAEEFRLVLEQNEELTDVLARVESVDYARQMNVLNRMIARDRRIADELRNAPYPLSAKQKRLLDEISARLAEYDRLRSQGKGPEKPMGRPQTGQTTSAENIQSESYVKRLISVLQDADVQSYMTDAQKEIANKLAKIIKRDVWVVVGNESVDNLRKNSLGFANFWNTGRSPVAFVRQVKSPQGVHALLHEATHIALIERFGFLMRQTDSPKAKALVEDLRDVFVQASERATSDEWYGLTNIDEFMAESLSNPAFQKWLKEQPWKQNMSLWDRLVELAARLLGFRGRDEKTLLSRTMELTDALLEEAHNNRLKRHELDFPPDFGNPAIKYARSIDEKFSEAELFYFKNMAQTIERLASERGFVRNEPNYLPRFWRIDKILEDEAGPKQLRAILADWFRNHPDPRGAHAGSPEKRAQAAINTIIQQAELGEFQAFNPKASASFLKMRVIDIPNSYVLPFIETDIEKVIRTYSERFGIANEIYRIFGEGDASSAIDDILIQTAREMDVDDVAKGLEEMAKAREMMERARDKLTGKIYEMEPGLVNQRRIASALSSYGVITYLGSAMLSSIPEVARMFMVHGFSRTFDGISRYAFGQKAEFKEASKRIANLTLQGLDSVQSTALARFVEQGGPTGEATTKIGRFGQQMTNFATGPYFILNLLAPFTDITKRISATFTHQFMLEDILALAKGEADNKTVAILASYGIDKEMAQRIARQPYEKAGDFYLPNAGEWPDADAARVFLTAVAGMTKNIVPTAGLADIPEIAKGFVKGREYPLLRLPFMFMTYGFGAINRILLSSLQGRDRSSVAGMAALVGLGYLSQSLKLDDDWWDNMSPEERAMRAIDASGITGVYSDLVTMAETASLGTVGIRPLIGLEPFIRNPNVADVVGEATGPVGGAVANVARVMLDNDVSDRETAETIRKIMPGHSLFYLKSLMKNLVGSAFGVEDGQMAANQ
jgi:hypothetical protein